MTRAKFSGDCRMTAYNTPQARSHKSASTAKATTNRILATCPLVKNHRSHNFVAPTSELRDYRDRQPVVNNTKAVANGDRADTQNYHAGTRYASGYILRSCFTRPRPVGPQPRVCSSVSLLLWSRSWPTRGTSQCRSQDSASCKTILPAEPQRLPPTPAHPERLELTRAGHARHARQ